MSCYDKNYYNFYSIILNLVTDARKFDHICSVVRPTVFRLRIKVMKGLNRFFYIMDLEIIVSSVATLTHELVH